MRILKQIIRRLLILAIRFRDPDPLNDRVIDLPAIDVLIPAANKDLNTLNHVVKSLHKHCRNPIGKITVVTPDPTDVFLHDYYDVKVVSDESLLKFREQLEHEFKAIKGWSTQQIIKLMYASRSKFDYVLWIDADTILNQDRTFVDQQSILELISDEYHKPYFVGLDKLFSLGKNTYRMSRVAHHNIVSTVALRKFIAQFDIKNENDWLSLIKKSVSVENKDKQPNNWFIFGQSSFSEYELNSLILKAYKVRTKKVYWWNESRNTLDLHSSSFNHIESGILEKLSFFVRPTKPYSISFHTWNQLL